MTYSLHWKPIMCFGRHNSFNSNKKKCRWIFWLCIKDLIRPCTRTLIIYRKYSWKTVPSVQRWDPKFSYVFFTCLYKMLNVYCQIDAIKTNWRSVMFLIAAIKIRFKKRNYEQQQQQWQLCHFLGTPKSQIEQHTLVHDKTLTNSNMCYSLIIQSRKLLSRLRLNLAVRLRVGSSSVVLQSVLKLFDRTVYVYLRTSVDTISGRLRCCAEWRWWLVSEPRSAT